MRTINEIKMLIAKKGMTLTAISEFLNKNSNRKYSLDTLSKRLRADTIRYSEMKLIAEALGMELIFKDK